MDDHTITVVFDDEQGDLEGIVLVLNDAGYVVKERTKIE